MSSRFTEIVIDCHDPRLLAEFWCAVLGYEIIDDTGQEVEIAGWTPSKESTRQQPMPPTLLFVPVPDSKTVKNRLHIDASPFDCERDAEVERLIGLGARRIDIGQGEQSWVVLADPEGNEFCVLRSLSA